MITECSLRPSLLVYIEVIIVLFDLDCRKSIMHKCSNFLPNAAQHQRNLNM